MRPAKQHWNFIISLSKVAEGNGIVKGDATFCFKRCYLWRRRPVLSFPS